MFEELPFIIGFMTLSVIFSYITIKFTSGTILRLIKALSVIGIVIHELFHIFMCLVTHAPIEHISLIKKNESEKNNSVNYYGEVKVRKEKTTFIQAFLISFAPLYLSFWVFFFLLNYLLTNQVHELIFFICIFTMISLILSAAPSFTDLGMIIKAFQNNPRHSSYQILVIGFSILITWIIITAYSLLYLHEIFIYMIIAGVYFCFKGGYIFTRRFLQFITTRKHELSRPHKVKAKVYTRKQYKPKKPRGHSW